ncbi:Hypothetical protein CpATCC19410_2267 [Corynebacterium pseudotuberculosis]|nr:Hypothetical protein CpATCC19410_2267 [Corynebacterium pseudotuberculosis]
MFTQVKAGIFHREYFPQGCEITVDNFSHAPCLKLSTVVENSVEYAVTVPKTL